MTFPYPADPKDWQTAYPSEQAYRDSWRLFPLTGLVETIAMLFILAYGTFRIIRLFLSFKYDLISTALIAVAVIGVIIIGFLLIENLAFRSATDFFAKLYIPPENVNPSKIIKYRLKKKIKLPVPLNDLMPAISQFKYIIARDGEIDKQDQWPAWMACNLGGPILLIVFDGCALYLERGNRFSRIVGPSQKPPFLEWHETIKYAVDLRPKVKIDNLSVWTKDGISVKLTIRIECRIGDPDPAKANPKSGLVYPFDPEAVKKAIERYAVRWPDSQAEPSEFNWVDVVWGQITSVVPDYVSSRMLDDIFIADREGGQILAPESLGKIFRALNKSTNSFGVYVTDFQILGFDIPPEMEELRREYWKTKKESISTILDGQAKAYGIRARKKAHADAQRDLILAIAEGLEKNKDGQYAEPLLLSLSGILDNSLTDPLLRAYLAKETLETLEQLRRILSENEPSDFNRIFKN